MGSLFCSSKLIVFYFKQAQEGCFTEKRAMMVKEKRSKRRGQRGRGQPHTSTLVGLQLLMGKGSTWWLAWCLSSVGEGNVQCAVQFIPYLSLTTCLCRMFKKPSATWLSRSYITFRIGAPEIYLPTPTQMIYHAQARSKCERILNRSVFCSVQGAGQGLVGVQVRQLGILTAGSMAP